jgi:hypothetical protein
VGRIVPGHCIAELKAHECILHAYGSNPSTIDSLKLQYVELLSKLVNEIDGLEDDAQV